MSKGGKKQTGAGAQGNGAGAEVNSKIPKRQGRRKYGALAAYPNTPINVARTASAFRASSCRITRQIGSMMMTPRFLATLRGI